MFHWIKSKSLVYTTHQQSPTAPTSREATCRLAPCGAVCTKAWPPSIARWQLTHPPAIAGIRGDRPPWGHTRTRGTKLTLYSSSSKQTACQVSLGESEFTLRASWHCAAVIDLCIYIFCDLRESSLPLPDIHHPTNCNLICCFSVILMAGLLFTVEALIWGYAISEFNGTFSDQRTAEEPPRALDVPVDKRGLVQAFGVRAWMLWERALQAMPSQGCQLFAMNQHRGPGNGRQRTPVSFPEPGYRQGAEHRCSKEGSLKFHKLCHRLLELRRLPPTETTRPGAWVQLRGTPSTHVSVRPSPPGPHSAVSTGSAPTPCSPPGRSPPAFCLFQD